MYEFRPASIPLCASEDLQEGGLAFGFDVVYAGQTARAFAIRYKGVPHAYLNRCTHVPVELDSREGEILDDSGRWLLCSMHGAAYAADTGQCVGGPCRGGLIKIVVSETAGEVRWHTAPYLQSVEF